MLKCRNCLCSKITTIPATYSTTAQTRMCPKMNEHTPVTIIAAIVCQPLLKQCWVVFASAERTSYSDL